MTGDGSQLRLSIVSGREVATPVVKPTGSTMLGRSKECDIILTDPAVSREHAAISPSGGHWHLIDRESRHGTTIDSRRAEAWKPYPLEDGNLIAIGPWLLQVSIATDVQASIPETDGVLVTMVEPSRPAVDPADLLRAAIDLPHKLGEASTESELFWNACTYIADTLGRATWSVHVVVAATGTSTSLDTLADSRDGSVASTSLNDQPVLLSRRVVKQLCQNEDSVAFLSRSTAGETIGATVPDDMDTVGACLIEYTADQRPIILYVLGRRAVGRGKEWVGEYLGLVRTLIRQHLLTIRRARLARYFSPPVIELMMKRGGQEQVEGNPRVVEATSLFFDLRGFSLSTEAHARDLLPLHADMQQIMSIVTEEVFRTRGTVIDYRGDGLFAAWGAPHEDAHQSDHAVGSAIEILRRLRHADIGILRNAFEAAPHVCGIGLARGDVLSGPTGSADQFKYGILGSSVNIAARLESLTKPGALNEPIIMTEAVRKHITDIKTRPLGSVELRGMSQPQLLHAVILDQ